MKKIIEINMENKLVKDRMAIAEICKKDNVDVGVAIIKYCQNKGLSIENSEVVEFVEIVKAYEHRNDGLTLEHFFRDDIINEIEV